jgi:adenylate cyclase
MPSGSSEVALLLADIAGSTPLFEQIGDAAAVQQIGECLDRLKSIAGREGGTFIRSRGDDVLCTFTDPGSALRAAREMLSGQSAGPLSVHAGLHFGPVIETHDDLFGDAVNLTARLAALAQPGEMLVSRGFIDRLSERESRSFRLLDQLVFKGRDAPAEVYSLIEDDGTTHTEIMLARKSGSRALASELIATLRYGEDSRRCRDGEIVLIGRSPDCNLVMAQPWISRMHAILTVRRGKVHLEDRSSSGTYVTMGRGQEFFMHRESALLTGSGIISPTMRASEAGAEILHYEIMSSTDIWEVAEDDKQ